MIALADEMPLGGPPAEPGLGTAGSGAASSVCLLFHLEMFLAIYNRHGEQTFNVERETVPAKFHLPTPRRGRDDMRPFGYSVYQRVCPS